MVGIGVQWCRKAAVKNTTKKGDEKKRKGEKKRKRKEKEKKKKRKRNTQFWSLDGGPAL